MEKIGWCGKEEVIPSLVGICLPHNVCYKHNPIVVCSSSVCTSTADCGHLLSVVLIISQCKKWQDDKFETGHKLSA